MPVNFTIIDDKESNFEILTFQKKSGNGTTFQKSHVLSEHGGKLFRNS
jgi:hypothetical protein